MKPFVRWMLAGFFVLTACGFASAQAPQKQPVQPDAFELFLESVLEAEKSPRRVGRNPEPTDQATMRVMTHCVADLVVPIPNYALPVANEEELIRLITRTVRAVSWSDVGGKNTVQYVPLGMALAINAPMDV